MHSWRTTAMFLVVLFGIGTACLTAPPSPAPLTPAPAEKPVARGSRTLAIDVNEAADGNYDKAFRLARRAGAQSVTLSIAWDSLETGAGRFSPDPDYLSIANAYYPAFGTPLVLTLAPIDTNRACRGTLLVSGSMIH